MRNHRLHRSAARGSDPSRRPRTARVPRLRLRRHRALRRTAPPLPGPRHRQAGPAHEPHRGHPAACRRRRRPHALGNPRPALRGERASAAGPVRARRGGAQRHHRELRDAAPALHRSRRALRLRDRHRGARPPRRRRARGRGRPRSGTAGRAHRDRGRLLRRRDRDGRSGEAGGRARRERRRAGDRPRRRRAVRRLGPGRAAPVLAARHLPRPRRDRRHSPRGRHDHRRRRRARRAAASAAAVRPGGGGQGALPALHAEGDPRAAGCRARHHARALPPGSAPRRAGRRLRDQLRAGHGAAAGGAGGDGHLPVRGDDRAALHRALRALARRGRQRLGVRLPPSGAGPTHARRLGRAVGRDGGHAAGDGGGAPRGLPAADGLQHAGIAGHAHRRRRDLHARRPGDRRSQHEDA